MGRKILLIEDDRETASYLTKGLNQEGHSVEQATNGMGSSLVWPALLRKLDRVDPTYKE